MSVRPIVTLGNPVLRRPATPVTKFDTELRSFVTELYGIMYAAEGIGLAAPQVGVSSQVCVVDVRSEGGYGRLALVNPLVSWSSRVTEKENEGCLSIPGMEGVVERPFAVRVEALDPSGEPLAIDADGILARALQHEIDHLNGIMFIDRLSPLKRRMLLKKWRKSGRGRS